MFCIHFIVFRFCFSFSCIWLYTKDAITFRHKYQMLFGPLLTVANTRNWFWFTIPPSKLSKLESKSTKIKISKSTSKKTPKIFILSLYLSVMPAFFEPSCMQKTCMWVNGRGRCSDCFNKRILVFPIFGSSKYNF